MVTGTPHGNDGRLFTGDDLEEMVLRLAHEVRNPLATIKSSAQLIRRLRLPAEELLPYIESMIVEVGRIDQTIHEMERFTRLRASTARAVAVARVAAHVIAVMKDEAENSGVNLGLGNGPDVSVLIDPEHLKMALGELVANAMHASRPNGPVTISWERGDKGLVGIHVDDEGGGVPEELSGRILRPFFSTSTKGTGLGLNTVQRICRLADGRLEWHNRPTGGCRFTMILPEVRDGALPGSRG